MKNYNKVLIATAVLALTVACSKEKETGKMSTSNEPVKLKFHYHSNNRFTDRDKEGKLLPVFQIGADKSNVILESISNPVAQSSPQEFQLQAAEGFPADIYGGAVLTPEMQKYGLQGAFLPLNDLIEKHGPNIKKYLDSNPEVKKALTAPDGKIYTLNYVPEGTVARVYYIRQDWLDKLGLQMPKTTEELEAVLIAFRDKDPNGNGLKDEIPVFNDKRNEMIRLVNLWGARAYGNDSYAVRVVKDNDGNYSHAWLSEDFKNGIKNLARWYKMGLIDQEFLTRKENTARQTLWAKENTGGMTHEWVASTGNYNSHKELKKTVPDFKIVGMLPPDTIKGKGFEEHRRIEVKPDGWAISHSSKNPEAAIRFMDYYFSPEGNRTINFGVEGVTYDMIDGKPVFKPEVIAQNSVNVYLQTNFGAQLPMGYVQDYEYERQWTSDIANEAVDTYKANKVYDGVKMTPVISFSTEEKAAYDRITQPLNMFLDEMVNKMLVGQMDIDKEWDAYVAEAKKLGADEIVAVYADAEKRLANIK